MKKKTLLKITTFSFATCLAAGIFVCSNPAQASAEDKTPSCEIFAQTLSLQDNIYIRYAVDFQELADGDKTGVIVWNAPQESYDSENFNNENAKAAVKSTVECTYNGNTYPTFAYTELAAKNMTDVVYARAYVEREGTYYYSNVKKYSILEYAYNKLGMTEAKETEDEKLVNLLNAMLAYGGAAQKAFNHKADAPASVDGFTYVRVANATFEDGFSYGLFQKGSTVKVIPDEGYGLVATGDSPFAKNEDGTLTLTVPAEKLVDESSIAEPPKYSEGLAFNKLSDGTYEVAGLGTCTDTDIVIPATYDNQPVTSIGERAFIQCNDLTSVIIPDSVTSICNNAFYQCKSLASVEIPDRVTSIGNSAFYQCKSLASIEIPDSVITIGTRAFDGCNFLTSVTIGSGVTNIGDYAFASIGVTSVVIPAGVTSMTGAFRYCFDLTSVVISDGVTTISEEAFYQCSGLTSVTIPDSVTTIGKHAFNSCSKLTEITFSNNVTTIDYRAFASTGLTSVTIPNSVTNITAPFEGCENLKTVTLEAGNTKYHMDGNCIIETATKTLVVGFNNSTIPSDGSVTTIGYSAFSKCTFESIAIPDCVTTIGNSAFHSCSSLTSVTLPDSVTTLDESAFFGCTNLKDITFSKNLHSIGRYAFSSTGIESITIPAHITTIAASAFSNCSSLTTVIIEAQITLIDSNCFYNCGSLDSVYIPKSVKTIYGTAFDMSPNIKNIYFEGTSEEWSNISKKSWNSYIEGKYTVHYNAKVEDVK